MPLYGHTYLFSTPRITLEMPVTVLFTNYHTCVFEGLLETYKNVLPERVVERAFRFSRWQDRQALLLGKLLIWKGLKDHHYDDDCLKMLHFNKYGKPYVDGKVFFNLSHAGRYVVCAFASEEIGIDIEEIRPIEIDDFISIFSVQEINLLRLSKQPQTDFFRIWTLKESVVKADGRGMATPLPLIIPAENGSLQTENMIWHVREISMFPGYCCALACTTHPSSLMLKKIDFGVGQPG